MSAATRTSKTRGSTPKGPRGRFDLPPFRLTGWIGQVGDGRDPRDVRQHLLENFDALALRTARRATKPRHVLRRAILAACNRQRIAGGGHHQRYGLGGGARG